MRTWTSLVHWCGVYLLGLLFGKGGLETGWVIGRLVGLHCLGYPVAFNLYSLDDNTGGADGARSRSIKADHGVIVVDLREECLIAWRALTAHAIKGFTSILPIFDVSCEDD